MYACGVKILVIAVVALLGCRKDAPSAERWPEVERLATPLVPAADGSLLDRALDQVTLDDVPEAALDAAIAWRKAGGGLPWRGGRVIEDQRPMFAFKLGKALVERRAADPEAIHTALYLAHRLRAESPAMFDVVVGFELTKQVVAGKHASRPELAPTDTEVRRALAAEAVHAVGLVSEDARADAATTEQVKGHYVALVIGAPADREAFVAHVEAMQKKFEKSQMMSMLVTPRMPKLVREMFETVDAYPR